MTKTLTAAAIAASLALTGCVNRDAQEQAKRTEVLVKDPSIVVSVMTAELTLEPETLQVTGQIQAEQGTDIGATLPGRITAVYVEDGDMVMAGQTIAEMDRRDANAAISLLESQAAAARSQLAQAEADAKVGPLKSAAAVTGAEARLRQAEARLQKLLAGSRDEERLQADASVRSAESDLETAKLNMERMRRLFKEGAIPKLDLETAENRYENALAGFQSALQAKKIVDQASRPEDIAAAREDVNAAKQQLLVDKATKSLDGTYQQRVDAARANLNAAEEGVRRAEITLSDLRIKAPFNGRISGRPLQVGTVVGPGTAVASLVGTSDLTMEASVPELQVPNITVGSLVSVRVDALGDYVMNGVVEAIRPMASSVARQYVVRIVLNDTHPDVKWGMFARGEIALGGATESASIPAGAVIRNGESSFVYLAVDGKSVRAPIVPGKTESGLTKVTGLEDGDQVIVKGQSVLVDGSVITIEEAGGGE
jgi:RND family efflux transporter MFP subunit